MWIDAPVSPVSILTNSARVVSSYVLQSSVDMVLVLLILPVVLTSPIARHILINKYLVVLSSTFGIVPVFVVEILVVLSTGINTINTN